MAAVENFILAVEQFIDWANAPVETGRPAAIKAHSLITNLYQVALQLPVPPEVFPEPPNTTFDREKWYQVFADAQKSLPFDFYGYISDPTIVPPEPPVVASLADDIADIYQDVSRSLLQYQLGFHDAAIWQWRFDLNTHWGVHATSAIHVLQVWLRSY